METKVKKPLFALDKKKLQETGLSLLITLIALVMALVVGALVIWAFGSNPIEAYGALWRGAFGTGIAFTVTLGKAVPVMLTGLAVAIAFRCSVFNIGAEGQLLIGAMCAALVGAYVHLPMVLHLPLTILASMVGGMIWAFFPAVLKLKGNVNVVISTIMFNYIAQYLISYLILGPFKGPGESPATATIDETAQLPDLLPKPYVLNLGFVLALVAVVAVYIILNRTSLGYEMRAVGFNPNASRTNGINVNRNMFLALLISGALAGLAGGIEVTGSLDKIVNNFSANYGFNGIPVALMAHNNPFAIIFSALLIGAMRSGSAMMQSSAGISKNMVDVIQGLIIVFLCAEHVIRYYIKRMGGKKNA
ncbi:sugar ABC transporter permease [Gemmiger sp. An87]|uniref:ABC transporter permease n=1 Tax=Allofournierella massiliensis TaxID=1650663 RepID=A0ABT7USF4_9FIRM|nr:MULTISPECIES: ABC transporter permease [Fournierella]MDM8201808.1 ABC transporter permease [Fournierella massiliensis]OUN15855.1 sugar ABC transporter permease [Gemmiger sp. An87]